MSSKMDLNPPPTTSTTTTPVSSSSTVTKSSKSQTLTQLTIRHPPFSYAHLSLSSPTYPPSSASSAFRLPQLDALTARSYLSAALRQFLGDTGASMAIDILLIEYDQCWVRVPREDLATFAAAVTAYSGHLIGGEEVLMRVVGCGDWLGSLVGREGERGVWG